VRVVLAACVVFVLGAVRSGAGQGRIVVTSPFETQPGGGGTDCNYQTTDCNTQMVISGSLPFVDTSNPDNEAQPAIAVTIETSVDSVVPYCTAAGHGGPWRGEWVERPNGAYSPTVVLGVFPSLVPGKTVTGLLRRFAPANGSNRWVPWFFWTGNTSACAQFDIVGGGETCASPTVSAHAQRVEDSSAVEVSLVVHRPPATSSSCRLSARITNTTVALQQVGSAATATVKLSDRAEVCTDTELIHVSNGDAAVQQQLHVPGDQLTFATARAVRQSDGTIVATARITGLLPTAKCGNPTVAVRDTTAAFDMTVTRISAPSSGSATAVRTVPATTTLCAHTLDYTVTQGQATARAERTVSGAPCTLTGTKP